MRLDTLHQHTWKTYRESFWKIIHYFTFPLWWYPWRTSAEQWDEIHSPSLEITVLFPHRNAHVSLGKHITVQRIFHMNLWKSFTAIKLEGFILSLKTFSFYISQCVSMWLCVFSSVIPVSKPYFEKKKRKKKHKKDRKIKPFQLYN